VLDTVVYGDQMAPKEADMSDDRSMYSEDIELDEGTADAVVGGAHKHAMTFEQAARAGYEPIASSPDGATLMRNPKTGKEIRLSK
jgi:hypothetical protein